MWYKMLQMLYILLTLDIENEMIIWKRFTFIYSYNNYIIDNKEAAIW